MKTGRPSKRPRPPFGERLHKFREEAGLTQAQVAKELSISARAYAFWEREQVSLKVEQLTILSNVLGATIEQLVGNKQKSRRGGPTGKMRQLFETASQLPRTQQQKIAEFVEPFIAQKKAAR